jgi:hypothetical protein
MHVHKLRDADGLKILKCVLLQDKRDFSAAFQSATTRVRVDVEVVVIRRGAEDVLRCARVIGGDGRDRCDVDLVGDEEAKNALARLP